MPLNRKKFFWIAGFLLVVTIVVLRGLNQNALATPATPTVDISPSPTWTPAKIPVTIRIQDGPLKNAIIDAGDYLVRQQLPNGELSYQVDFMSGERSYSPSYLRLIGGTGSLFTVCRVSGDSKYCDAGDLALEHYLEFLISEPETFKGTCLYTSGNCQLGGSALTVDAIYKRWQATGDLFLGDRNLLNTAIDLGYFIVSMRRPEGGFYHSYDPHFGGTVDSDFVMTNFPGESLLALTQLYEMTGNEFWLKQARDVNDFMIAQPISEDHWHSYVFSMLARLDALTETDKSYARQIADSIIAGEVRSLHPSNNSISSATKVEALSALAQAFYLSDTDHKWLDPEIRTFITFVQARQLPGNNCGWTIPAETAANFGGGIFSSCEEPTIRVDGLQNWINGATTYLEYQSMINEK
ncbi:MAG: hypothetical protein IPN58_11795 [Anaerolineales bacterium]|nr:hypothetical protein [Anaerolineales bacterium]